MRSIILKTMVSLLVSAALVACSSGDDAESSIITPPKTEVQPQQPVTNPVVEPLTPVVSTQPPVTISPQQGISCVRDTTPFVYVAPYWYDSCGARHLQSAL